MSLSLKPSVTKQNKVGQRIKVEYNLHIWSLDLQVQLIRQLFKLEVILKNTDYYDYDNYKKYIEYPCPLIS